MKRIFLFLASIILISYTAYCQRPFDQQVQEYVQLYKDIAIRQQIESGIPAAIILAQGICETSAGSSELCLNANNHFGIKCKHKWQGATYAYTDDAPDECFRKYKTPLDSYKDHTAFLQNNPRYAGLFLLDPEDYKSWARGLKRCGYATNPAYATKLISYIEKYDLEQYTLLAMLEKQSENSDAVSLTRQQKINRQPAQQQVTNATFENLGYARSVPGGGDTIVENSDTAMVRFYETIEKNGLKGFYAPKGDWLLEYAIKHHIRYSKLLSWNDLKDQALPSNLFIYLQPKRKQGIRPVHTVSSGETLLQISQEEGIQLDQLMILNKILPGEQPVAGTRLTLQQPSESKPEVYEFSNAQPSASAQRPAGHDVPGEYIPTDHGASSSKTPRTVVPQPSAVTKSPVEEVSAITPSDQSVATSEEDKITDDQEYTGTQPVVATTPNQEKRPDPAPVSARQSHKNEKQAKEPETPLEKLRAYMDKVVYAENEENNSSGGSQKEEKGHPGEEPVATLPAGRESSTHRRTAEKKVSQGDRFYTVKRGDTAFSIAKRYQISLAELKKWNHLPESMTVVVGQKLQVAR